MAIANYCVGLNVNAKKRSCNGDIVMDTNVNSGTLDSSRPHALLLFFPPSTRALPSFSTTTSS